MAAAASAAASADAVDHVEVEAVEAAFSDAVHHATTATKLVTSPVSAPSLDPKLATVVARTDTSLATVTLLTAVDQADMETATETATPAANQDTFLAIAPMVAISAITVNATAVERSVTFLAIALRALAVMAVLEETRLTMSPTTDSR